MNAACLELICRHLDIHGVVNLASTNSIIRGFVKTFRFRFRGPITLLQNPIWIVHRADFDQVVVKSYMLPACAVWSSVDPDILCMVSLSTNIVVINTKTGQELHCLQGHTRNINTLAWDSTGTKIVSGSLDTTTRLWNLSTNECQVIYGHTREVTSVAFHPDNTKIVSGRKTAPFESGMFLPCRCCTNMIPITAPKRSLLCGIKIRLCTCPMMVTFVCGTH